MKIKESILCILFIILSLCFISCGSDSDESYNQVYTYSNAEPYVELGDNASSITLNGVAGKTIVYANVNTSKYSVPSSLARYVTDSQYSSRACDITSDISCAENKISLPDETCGIRNFVPPKDFKIEASSSSRSAGSEEETYSDNFNVDSNCVVDTSYRYVYLDQNTDIDSFAKEKVILHAIGKNSESKTICLLWVADDSYSTSTSSDDTINSSVAQSLASTFAEHYAHETSVFGSESNIFYDDKSLTLDSKSPTNKYVNIVVYDIGKDYSLSYSEQCGVVGYFYAKDYIFYRDNYSNAYKYSNQGKYFYIDAAFCNLSGSSSSGYEYNGVTKSGSSVPSDTVISTLFHEFQHMIDFNQKNIIHNVYPNTWYNEMLSMLAEDMMQTQLGLSNSEAPKGSRLPTFNKYYYLSGVTDYLSGNYAVISYSTSYAFGAWLSRNYGGPELVSKISQNSYVDMDSVVDAVNSLNGTSVTQESLLKEYVKACVYRNDFASTYNLSTFNKDAGGGITTTDGYTSSMSAINLFSATYSNTRSSTTYLGPLFAIASQQLAVRPTGFVLHSVGTVSSSENTITLYFSSQLDSDDHVVIYIQDEFTNTAS